VSLSALVGDAMAVSARQQGCEQRGSRRNVLEDDRFVGCVRTFTYCAQAVECGHAERGGKVAIGCAACRGFVQHEAQICGKGARLLIELNGSAAAFHRRTIDVAGHVDLAALVRRLEVGKEPLNARAICLARDSYVHFGRGVCGNHIGLASAVYCAYVHGEAALKVGPVTYRFDDAGNLANGAGAFFKVDPRVRSDAFHVDTPVACAFARGFARQTLRRLKHINGGTLLRKRCSDGA